MRSERFTCRGILNSFVAALGMVVVLVIQPYLAAEPAGKLPAPTTEQQAAAQKLIREVYHPEAAKTAGAKKAAAEKMLKEAADTADPVARFVLYSEATRLAAAGGDVAAVIQALNGLAEGYAADLWPTRIAAIRALELSVPTHQDAVDAVSATVDMVDLAIASGESKAADQLLLIADRLATKTGDKPLRASVRQRQATVRELATGEAKTAAAQKALALNPEDADANLAVGKFECLLKGNWPRGLPLLAKGSDAALAALAKRDLVTPDDAAAQGCKQIGDGWWDAAAAHPGAAKLQLQSRAAYWYRKAAKGELKGLDKTVVDKRLAEVGGGAREPGVIDILKLVGAHHRADWGTWALGNNGLDCTSSGRAMLPYAPPDEYDLTLTFTRNSGGDTLGVFCPLSKGTVVWAIGGMHGLANINGRNGWHSLLDHGDKGALTNSVPHSATIRVRKAGIQAFFDGKLDSELATDGSGYDNDALKINGIAVLALHTQDTATFTKIILTEITGHGHVVAEK